MKTRQYKGDNSTCSCSSNHFPINNQVNDIFRLNQVDRATDQPVFPQISPGTTGVPRDGFNWELLFLIIQILATWAHYEVCNYIYVNDFVIMSWIRTWVFGQLCLFLFLVVGSLHAVYAGSENVPEHKPFNLLDANKRNKDITDTDPDGWRTSDTQLWTYKNNSELAIHLKGLEKRCKKFAKVEHLGESEKGEDILVIHMSKYIAEGSKGLPRVKIVGNLHGDEPTGRVFTVALAEWLCEMYDKGDKVAIDILNKVDLWLLPTVNPDGFAAHRRGNSLGVDLNRDFPDRFNEGVSSNWLPITGKEQKETRAIMDWILDNGPFVSSLAIHEGALVANYPWDGSDDESSTYQASPDDATFKYLASEYAFKHRKMSLPSNPEFPKGGITNGANWYPIYGSMQDWNYIVGSCMELTLEVSLKKWPREATLSELFEDNRKAMLDFIWRTTYGGFTGIVYGIHNSGRKTGKENIPIPASVKLVESFLNTTTDPETGKFYRPLAPGKYEVAVTANGFKQKRIEIEVPEDGTGAFERIYLNKNQEKTKKASPNASSDIYWDMQSGIILIGGSAVTLAMLWRIHLSLISRQATGSLMKILKK